jgi:hypothetical protein
LFFALCLALAGTAFAGPRLVVPEKQFDAKRVKEGDIVTHGFAIQNRGDQPLVIHQVKPDCGCTSAEFDETIPAGGEGHITLRLDTRGYRGRIAKHTRVFTSDPQQKLAVLTMEAEVWTPIVLSKTYVVFKGTAGDRLADSIEVRAGMNKPLTLEAEAFDLENKVDYRIEEVEEGKAFRIHFSSLPGPEQRYHGTLKLRTNYPEKPEIEIRIRARFKETG